MTLIVFATNIRPAELVDEAFLRRIRYKVLAESPTVEEFRRFSRAAACSVASPSRAALVERSAERLLPARADRAARLSSPRPDRPGALAGRVPRPAATTDDRAPGGGVRELLRGRRGACRGVRVSRPLPAGTARRDRASGSRCGPGRRGSRTLDAPTARTRRAYSSTVGSHHVATRPRRVAGGHPHRRAGDPRAAERHRTGQVLRERRARRRGPGRSSVRGPVDRRQPVRADPHSRRSQRWRSATPRSDAIDLAPFEIVETTGVSSVLLEATVMDKAGRFVGGLDAASFRVLENDEPQTIDLARTESLPVTYTLLVDASQSMHARMEFVRTAAGRLADFLRPNDRIIVAPFAKSLGAITGPTGDRETIAGAVQAIASSGGTAICDGLIEASRLVSGSDRRHVIVLITDGYDEHSRTTMEDALAAAQSARAAVYVIGVGGVAGISLKGERALRQIARETGGRVFFPSREQELPAVHELVAEDVQQRYLICVLVPEIRRPTGPGGASRC